jgi:hypothetical protein
VGQTTLCRKRIVETPDGTSQRKKKAKQPVRSSSRKSDGERTPTDEDVENELVSPVHQSLSILY